MSEQLLCPCEFQLVLVYNREPGELSPREVEPEVLAGIFLDLRKKFGNFTPLGRAGEAGIPGGEWEGLEEPSIRIEVAVPPDRVHEVERFVHDVGVRLKQKAMYFKAGPPCVKIIQVEATVDAPSKGGN